MGKNNSKINILGMVIAIATVIVILGMVLFGRTEVSAEEKVRINLHRIDESISEAIEEESELALSSNPYDYIENNEYYKNIIGLGVSALPELEKSLVNSETNGLNEYILAIAIEEITHADVNGILEEEYGWENAKEFSKEWTAIKENVNKEVLEIATSSHLTAIEKCEKLENYGVLAVPSIKEKSNARTIYTFENEIFELINSYELTENDLNILTNYLK